MTVTVRPSATASLVLADGTVFHGQGLGAPAEVVGELVFNTAMTGYQEILTDPSYAGQLITFTFPHIGNVGTNDEDLEATTCHARGVVLRAPITDPSNYRAVAASRSLARAAGPGRHCRHRHPAADPPPAHRRRPDRSARLRSRAGSRSRPPRQARRASGPAWWAWISPRRSPAASATAGRGSRLAATRTATARLPTSRYHVVAVDYGIKRNILRSLASLGLRVTVVPATHAGRGRPGAGSRTASSSSNGPGDPAATGAFAVPEIQKLRGQRQAPVRDLPRPSDAGAGARRRDREDEVRPSRRQPPGQGPDHRQGRDHEPEPRLRGAGPTACPRASRRPMCRCSTARSRA